MSYVYPIRSLGDAIVERIRANRASFSPAVVRVEYDDYWDLPAAASALTSQMPCVLVEPDQSPFELATSNPQGIVQSYNWILHYLFRLSDTSSQRGQASDAAAKLAALFTEDEFEATWWTVPDGVEVEHCHPSGMGPQHDLTAQKIGHQVVTLQVRIHSYPQQ